MARNNQIEQQSTGLAEIASNTAASTDNDGFAGLPAPNRDTARADLIPPNHREGAGGLNRFLNKWVAVADRVLDSWPKNVSVYASSGYDQFSLTNRGRRSQTGTYTDALLKNAGLDRKRFWRVLSRSLGDSHLFAGVDLKSQGGWLGVADPSKRQTPQTSKFAIPLSFRDKVCKNNHAVVISGFDSRDRMRLGFKDDGENLRKLFKKLGIPGENITEQGNTKKAAFEAYLKTFKDKKGDRFIIYYSGHGTHKLSKTGRSLVVKNLMKFDRLSRQEAKNVTAFIEDPKLCAKFVRLARDLSPGGLQIMKKYFPNSYSKFMQRLAKDTELSTKEVTSALSLLHYTRGNSPTMVRTQVFQFLGANNPKHYDGVLQAQGGLTERDLKRMTRRYLSGFKNVVIISDSCFAGALTANRGRNLPRNAV